MRDGTCDLPLRASPASRTAGRPIDRSREPLVINAGRLRSRGHFTADMSAKFGLGAVAQALALTDRLQVRANKGNCVYVSKCYDRAVAPSRGRGSKLRDADELRHKHAGRSLTGARIETCTSPPRGTVRWSLPHGGADRNSPKPPGRCPGTMSLPHGGADRNCDSALFWLRRVVAPSRGRGSKPNTAPRGGPRVVAPSRGRGSKHLILDRLQIFFEVAPSRGRGSKPCG